MTKSTLLGFQEKAVHSLASKMTKHWVLSKENKNYSIENPIVLASPTGSGKTIMVAEMMQLFKSKAQVFLEDNTYEYDENAQDILENFEDYEPLFVFVSPSTGNLDKQSATTLKEQGTTIQTLEEELLNVEYWDDIVAEGEFEPNTVIVLSWDKVNRVTNKSRTINETSTDTSFNMIVRKTRKNHPVIMFIDESHKNDTRKSKEIIDAFSPDILVKVSATPKESAIATGQSIPENSVLVSIEEARQEKLIKDSVEVIAHKKGVVFTRETVIEEAIAMQKTLEEALEHETIEKDEPDIPLVLIQIENDKKNPDTHKTNATLVFEKLLSEGIPEDEIAIWLTDKEGQGKKNIDPNLPEKINRNIRYLIFKTAIATGWDCPRAHILVKLRNVGSATLDIQTIGRIVRKANNKIGKEDDYDNAILKPAYIFVEDGISTTDFASDTAGLLNNFIMLDATLGKIKAEFKEDVEKFNNLVLQKDVTRKSEPDMSKYATQTMKNKIQASITDSLSGHTDVLIVRPNAYLEVSKNTEISVKGIYTGELSNVTKEFAVFESNAHAEQYFYTTLERQLNEKALFEMILDTFNRGGISKSRNRRKSFMDYILDHEEFDTIFEDYNSQLSADVPKIEKNKDSVIALFINNKEFFAEFSSRLASSYRKAVEIKTIIAKQDYYLPQTLNVNSVMSEPAKNYLYDAEPNLDTSSTVERDFANHLRNNENIKWWFKNATSGSNGLGLYFFKDNKPLGYYPDFIFESTDGKLYIVDTKEGTIDHTIKDKYNAGALFKNAMLERTVEGGYTDLVVSMVVKNKLNRFIISTSNEYVPYEDTPEYWENISF